MCLKVTLYLHILPCFTHIRIASLRSECQSTAICSIFSLEQRNRLLKIFHTNTEIQCDVVRTDIHHTGFNCACAFHCKRTGIFKQKIFRSTMVLPFILAQRELIVDRNSVVSIATCNELKGPGKEFRWGRDFAHKSKFALRPTWRPVQWVPSLFPGGRTAGT